MAFEKMSKAFLYVLTKTLHFDTLKYDKQSRLNGLLEIETSAKVKKRVHHWFDLYLQKQTDPCVADKWKWQHIWIIYVEFQGSNGTFIDNVNYSFISNFALISYVFYVCVYPFLVYTKFSRKRQMQLDSIYNYPECYWCSFF